MSGNALQTELQLYLREVKRVPLLTAEEEKELGWRIIIFISFMAALH